MNRREFFRRTAGVAAVPLAAAAAVSSGGYIIPQPDGSFQTVTTKAELESSLAAMNSRANLAIYKNQLDADIARGAINEQRFRDYLAHYTARIESATEALRASGQGSAALAAAAMSAISIER